MNIGVGQDFAQQGGNPVDFLSDGERMICADTIDELVQNRVDSGVLAPVGGFALRRQANMDMAPVLHSAGARDQALALKRGEHFVHLAFEQVHPADQIGCGHGGGIVRMLQKNAQYMGFMKTHGADQPRVPEG